MFILDPFPLARFFAMACVGIVLLLAKTNKVCGCIGVKVVIVCVFDRHIIFIYHTHRNGWLDESAWSRWRVLNSVYH